MTSLKLYSSPECHLCDDAVVVLNETVKDILIESVNIEGKPELLMRYEIRIPVLQRLDNNAELDWPFDGDDVRQFLENDPC